MKLSQKTLKILRKLIKISLIFVTLLGIYRAYTLWQYDRMYPTAETYVLTIGETLPIEALTKINLYNKAAHTIGAGLILVLVYFIIDYFYEPDKHFITTIKKWLEKIPDEEDEKNE